MTQEYKATLIGLGFTTINLLLTWTYIIPIFSVIPAAVLLESSFISIFGKEPFDTVGQATLITLIILVVLISFVYFRLLIRARDNNESFDIGMFIGFLFYQMFMIHPLVFYLILSENWNRAGDGQALFGVVVTFPISSFGFAVLGIVTDTVKNKMRKQLPTTLEKH